MEDKTIEKNSYTAEDLKYGVANTELARFIHPDAEESEDGKYLYI